MQNSETAQTIGIGIVVTLVVCAILALLFFGLPAWNVWRRGLSGEAQLREAEWNRQIAVQEAKAKAEAATMLATAEIERAKGVAEANKIIADGLKGHDEYLRYLWITERVGQGVQREVIYVPTEANIPVLEAQRLAPQPQQQ